jgi:acyl-CoA thioesterase FadM
MIADLIENYFPRHVISPYSCITILLGMICFFAVIRLFDLGLIIGPVYYDLVNYRFRSWLNKITFQKKPFVISRPELVTGGGGDDWTQAEHTTIYDTYVSTFDIDLMFHMNNARYLRNADLARFEYLHASGLFHAAWFRGAAFVTASQTIRYRREIKFGQKYRIITRCTGWDRKALFIEHVFCVKNEVHAILEVREGISVPKKIKEKYPLSADAPMLWIANEVLKWENFPEFKRPSADVDIWLKFFNDNYTRVFGDPSSPLSPLLMKKK